MRPIKYYRRRVKSNVLVMMLLMFILPAVVFAQETENLAARQLAADFITYRKQNLQNNQEKVSASDLQQTYRSSTEVSKPLFVFQNQNEGFVMVSQQNNGFNIIGYSDEGIFDADNIPPQLSALSGFMKIH